MSRKITANRKFLEEQVKTLLEYDPEENERNPPAPPVPEEDLGNTDKLPGDEDFGAVNVDALEYSDPVGSKGDMYELIMTIFFGLKSSRDTVIQYIEDHYDYGTGHDLANIHKALDRVDDLTPFEAVIFRFFELDLKPMAVQATSNMKWKNEIFETIEEFVGYYATKIYDPYRSQGKFDEKDVRKDYEEFIERAYKEIFIKYKLSDDSSYLDRILSEPYMFGGINPNKSIATKVTRKPSRDYVNRGVSQLVQAMEQGGFAADDGSDMLYDVSRGEIKAFLEKQLVHLSYPMSTGKNPTGKSIDSFEEMRIAAKDIESKNPVDPNRVLAAIAIREQSAANKRFANLAVSFSDVTLSIVGSVSLFLGLPGFLAWFRNMGLRGLGLFGHKGAKEFLKVIKNRYKKSSPSTFILGMSEFFAGLSVAFAQNIRNVENRLNRVQGFHDQYFSLLRQYIETPDAKSYDYLKSDVESYPYTKNEFGKVYDAFKSLMSSEDEPEEGSQAMSMPAKPDPQDEEDRQQVTRKDLLKVLDNILGAPEQATMGADIENQVQDFDSISPTTGSSIMQSWRDIYTLIIELQMSAAIYSVKPGADRERIRSRILNSADQKIQKEYEIFMTKIQNLYKLAQKAAIQSNKEELNSIEKDIDEILNKFRELVGMFKRQEKALEQEINEAKPLLQKMSKSSGPKKTKKKETNESILKEKTANNKQKPPKMTNQEKFIQDDGGHTITKIKTPKGAGSTTEQWMEVNHNDFKKQVKLTEKTAYAFVELRKKWKQKGYDNSVAPLIPSSVFREAGKESKGNHENGHALDIVTPKGKNEKKREFFHRLIPLAWLSGFRGFGFPQVTPCSNRDLCNTHIDTGIPRWWLYSETGKEVSGKDKWIYKNHDGWFVGNILIYKGGKFLSLMKELKQDNLHKKAIEDYKKEEGVKDQFKRQAEKWLKEKGLDNPTKLMSLLLDEFGDKFKEGDDKFKAWSKKQINDLGDVTSDVGEFLDRQVRKGREAKVDAIADRKYFQPNYSKSIKAIEEIKDIDALIREYTSEYGLARPNVTGRVNTVGKFARDMDNPDLSGFFKNKNKEFDRNILSRFKAKKRAADRFKVKESMVYEQATSDQLPGIQMPGNDEAAKTGKLIDASAEVADKKITFSVVFDGAGSSASVINDSSDPGVFIVRFDAASIAEEKRLSISDDDIEYAIIVPSKNHLEGNAVDLRVKIKNLRVNENFLSSIQFNSYLGDYNKDTEQKNRIYSFTVQRDSIVRTAASQKKKAASVEVAKQKVQSLFKQLRKNENLVGDVPMAISVGNNPLVPGELKWMAVKIDSNGISLNEKTFSFRKHAVLNTTIDCKIDKAIVFNDKMKIQLSFIGLEGTVTLSEEQVLNLFSVAMAIPSRGEASPEMRMGPKGKDKGSIKWSSTDDNFELPPTWRWNKEKKSLEIDPNQTDKGTGKPKKNPAFEKAPEFDLDIQLNYFLKDGQEMPNDEELKPGKTFINQKKMAISALKKSITKMLNDFNSSEFNKVNNFKAEYSSARNGNLILTKPEKSGGPITVTVKFKVKADPSFIKQIKGSGFDFNNPQAQSELNDYINKAIARNYQSAGGKALRSSLLGPFAANREIRAKAVMSKKFKDKPQVSKTEWDFEKATTQTVSARGSEDLDDPYEVSEFNKRKRLVEYIPTDFLKFSNESIFTVTLDLPGNGFDEFLTVNPTVIRGREPFSKSAPGQNEADRKVLLVILKRNRATFAKFLDKLEELSNIVDQNGKRSRIEFGRYSMSDYRVYKQYFQSYIKLFDAGISAIENVGEDDFDSILRRSYHLNLMSAAIYNL